jgi:hypothetical protein
MTIVVETSRSIQKETLLHFALHFARAFTTRSSSVIESCDGASVYVGFDFDRDPVGRWTIKPSRLDFILLLHFHFHFPSLEHFEFLPITTMHGGS